MSWIIVLISFIAIIAAGKILLERKERKYEISSYRKRERVMNESEQALFINLQKVLGDSYIVLSKIRIEDFVEVDYKKMLNYKSRWGLRGRIKSRHVDFLICDRRTTKPLLAIELDGKSHNKEGRKERDRFVNEIYDTIGLPIEHIHVGANFAESAQNVKNVLIVSSQQ